MMLKLRLSQRYCMNRIEYYTSDSAWQQRWPGDTCFFLYFQFLCSCNVHYHLLGADRLHASIRRGFTSLALLQSCGASGGAPYCGARQRCFQALRFAAGRPKPLSAASSRSTFLVSCSAAYLRRRHLHICRRISRRSRFCEQATVVSLVAFSY